MVIETGIPTEKIGDVSTSSESRMRFVCLVLVGRSSKRMKLALETMTMLFFVSWFWLSSISPRDSIGKLETNSTDCLQEDFDGPGQ